MLLSWKPAVSAPHQAGQGKKKWGKKNDCAKLKPEWFGGREGAREPTERVADIAAIGRINHRGLVPDGRLLNSNSLPVAVPSGRGAGLLDDGGR